MLKIYSKLRMKSPFSFAMLLFFTSGFSVLSVLAQETRSLSRAEFAGGVTISLSPEELGSGKQTLVVSDSLLHRLVLTGATLAGEAIWLQKTAEPVKKNGVIHWHFDEPTRRLIVDLSGIGEALSAGGLLSLRVAPLSTLVRAFTITAARADSPAAAVSETLQTVKTVRVQVLPDAAR